MVPFIILSKNFDSVEDKTIINIWSSLIYLGDIGAVFGVYTISYSLEISWPICFIFFLVVYFFLSLFLFLVAEEIVDVE